MTAGGGVRGESFSQKTVWEWMAALERLPNVYVATKLPPDLKAELERHARPRYWDEPLKIPRERLLREIGDAEGLIVPGGLPVDRELLAAAPRLRAVSTVSVGYNHFDLAAMRERGVVGTHTPHVLDDTVADLVLALMLAAPRRIPELDAMVKAGLWGKDGVPEEQIFGMDVHHAVLGIVGLGRIGEAIARRAVHGFSMTLLYHNRSRNAAAEEKYGARYCALDELLRASDFVVLMMPLTPDTAGFFGKEHFEKMKPTAFFINASRGGVVREADLVAALREGRIRGAGLDVYECEPVSPDNPLLKMPNVVTLPHIGSATAKTRHAMAALAVRNLTAVLRGVPGAHIVRELADLA